MYITSKFFFKFYFIPVFSIHPSLLCLLVSISYPNYLFNFIWLPIFDFVLYVSQFSHMRETIQYLSPCVWFISLNIPVTRHIHFITNDLTFGFPYGRVVLHCVKGCIFSIYLSVGGHKGCLQDWTLSG